MKPKKVIWFTGLSGSGKSSLAKKLYNFLKKEKFKVEIVDGDEFRKKIHPNLRFTPEEIKINNKKIIEYCKNLIKDRDFILVPVIAPFRSTRSYAKKVLKKSYVEVYCNSSLTKCIERDTKGLYKKALKGKIQNFVGIDKNVPYQIPSHPNLILDTENHTLKQNMESLEEFFKILK